MHGKVVASKGFRPAGLVRTVRAVPARDGAGFVGQILAGREPIDSTDGQAFATPADARIAAVAVDRARVKDGTRWAAELVEDERIDTGAPCAECNGVGAVTRVPEWQVGYSDAAITYACPACNGSAVES